MQRRFLVGAILLTGCGEKKDNAVILGVTAGSSEQIAEVVAKAAAKTGITIKVKTFGDYIAVDTAPNDPTNEGRALCKQLLTKVRSFIVVDSNTKRNRVAVA